MRELGGFMRECQSYTSQHIDVYIVAALFLGACIRHHFATTLQFKPVR